MKKSLFALCIIPFMFLVAACSTVPHEVETEALTPNWMGEPYKKLLIVGIYEDRAYRISSEISFSDELNSKGIKASPGYEVLPRLEALDNAAAVSEATSSKEFDALLTIATTDVDEEFTYGDALATRGFVRLMGGKPGAATETGILLAYLTSGTYALHIGLWDAKTQKLIWQATTHSVFQDTPTDEIKSLADLVLQKLRAKGLI